MADLVKALEADLFGAHEWAVDQYADLATVPDPAVRLVAQLGLLRAHEALGNEAASTEAVQGVVDEEDALPEGTRAVVETVQPPREALLDATDADAQASLSEPFLAAFDAAWARGPQDALVADALLAALVRANLLASRKRSTPGGPAALRDEAPLVKKAGATYEAVGALLKARVDAGEVAWQETARACHHRAMVAWRAVGDEARAVELEAQAGKLGGGGAAWYR